MKKIVLFGDSIFNGYRNRRDTNLVTDGLQKRLGNYAQVQNCSKSGATTVEALDFINQIDPTCDLVVIEFGTNDAATAWGITPESYTQNLQQIIKILSAKKLIIVGPSAPNPNNFEINQYYGAERLNRYNQIAQSYAHVNNSDFINLLTAFAQLKKPDLYYQNDGQHLTDLGNTLLLDTITPVIKRNLRQLGN